MAITRVVGGAFGNIRDVNQIIDRLDGTEASNGTSSAPLYAIGEATLGLWRIGSGNAGFSGSLSIKGPRPWADLKGWGCALDGTTDDSTLVQAADTALAAAGGGTVFHPGGTCLLATAISPSNNVTYSGNGENTSIYKRNSNIILFDVRGTAGSHRSFVNFRNLRITSTINTAWTNPLVRMYYGDRSKFDHVSILNGGGEAIRFMEWYDSYFYGCRFDSCGSNDGTKPAIYLLQDDTAGGFSSTQNCNNLWFTNCVWESNDTGNFWSVDPGGATRNNKIYLVSCKMENATNLRGDMIHIEGGAYFSIENLNLFAKEFASGAATAVNMIYVKNLAGGWFRNISFEGATPTGARTVQRGIYFDGTTANNDIYWDGLVGSFLAGNNPDGLVVYAGTNNEIREGAGSFVNNAGSAPLTSGTPTSAPVTGITSFSQVYLAAGAVATPSAAFLADSDTGIYNVSANVLGITAGAKDVARFNHPGGTPVNWIDFFSAVTGGAPGIRANGTDAAIVLDLRGVGANGDIQLASQNTSFVAVRGGASNTVSMRANGGTNASMRLSSSGTGTVELRTGDLNRIVLQGIDTASSVNFGTVTGSATGTPGSATFGVSGTDTDVDHRLGIRGAGLLDIRYAVTALGAGGAATLGLTGGSGPTATAQNSWLPIKINGTASWLPVFR